MRSEDVYVQGRRTWVRLHEKGGKRHEMPCHHSLDAYLGEYIEAADVADEPKGWLFRSTRARSFTSRTDHGALTPRIVAYSSLSARGAVPGGCCHKG